MSDPLDYRPVLAAYPRDCRPAGIEPLGSAGGFSGARLWRLETPRGLLCLRRWPPEHPTVERLEFLQAVLWHVHQEGFCKVPLPVETVAQGGYVRHAGHLWELSPWLPGEQDRSPQPAPARVAAALATLAEFHNAAASFPLPVTRPVPSPGVAERSSQLAALLAGDFARLREAVMRGGPPGASNFAAPSFAAPAARLVELFPHAAPAVGALLEQAARIRVRLQPCLRDVWRDNVLFTADAVTGLIDFGALRPESVAADVARLLGSLVEGDPTLWNAGLAAYERVRPLTEVETTLVAAFDRSGVLLGGVNWLTWLYDEGRHFDRPEAVLARLEYFVRRLARLV